MKNLLFLLIVVFWARWTTFAQTDTSFSGVKVDYFKNGQIKSKIQFKKGRPNGLAQMFNENGQLSESGYWITNKWVGNYIKYYPNGSIEQNFSFDRDGKRIGLQKYYYPNGILDSIVYKLDGKAEGFALKFNVSGNLKGKPKFYSNDIETEYTKTKEKFTVSFDDSQVIPENEEQDKLLSSLLDYVKNENLTVIKLNRLKNAEKEIELNKVVTEKEKLQKLIFGVLALFIFIIAVLIYRNLLKNKKQKRIIEEQKVLVDKAYETLHEKNKEVIDSINYASRIQRALITSDKYIATQLNRLMKND